MTMTSETVIITHPQNNYDAQGVITEGLSRLSGLEVLVLVNDKIQFENNPTYLVVKNLLPKDKDNVIYSYAGHLKPKDAQDLVESYESITLLGGCLSSCLYRTYTSLVKAFRKSPKKELHIKFFLDGIFEDVIPEGGVLNTLDILEDFTSVGIKREEALIYMMDKFHTHIEFGSNKINFQMDYNRNHLYGNDKGSDKSLKIEIFDKLPI